MEAHRIQPRLLTEEQAAKYLGRTRGALQELRYDGRIPLVRADRRVFYDVQELDRWIEAVKGLGSELSTEERREKLRAWVREQTSKNHDKMQLSRGN